jgi:hypothetical protein
VDLGSDGGVLSGGGSEAACSAVRCGGCWSFARRGECGAGSSEVGTVVGWATRASSDPDPLLPVIFLPLPWVGFRDGAGQICLQLAGFASSGGGWTLRRAIPSVSPGWRP